MKHEAIRMPARKGITHRIPGVEEFGIYMVGVKLALWKDGKLLVLRDKVAGWLDFPGGRIDRTEHEKPIEKIIAREIREEIGKVRYALGNPAFQYRRYHRRSDTYIFNTVYDARYLSGTITLSDEHGSYEWANPKKLRFSPRDVTTPEEYRALKKYLHGQAKKG